MNPLSFMEITQVIGFIYAILVFMFTPELLAIWRRWLGAEGTGPRSVKIAVLSLSFGSVFWLLTPSTIYWYVANVVHVTAISLWFVTAHNNGGEEGKGGPRRYGFAGLGYPVAYACKHILSPVKLFGWTFMAKGGWTEAGEIVLGYATGRVLQVFYALLFMIVAVVQYLSVS